MAKKEINLMTFVVEETFMHGVTKGLNQQQNCLEIHNIEILVNGGEFNSKKVLTIIVC